METTTPWYEIGSHIATMLGFVGIIFLFVQHYYDRDVRNLQLMQRCLDGFKEWTVSNKTTIDLPYLELLNEELFYIQRGLIDREVAVEWIEGILDYVAIYAHDGTVLNKYNQQSELDKLPLWQSKKFYFKRIHFFINTNLIIALAIPEYEAAAHSQKKQLLAKAFYRRIKKYKY